MFKQVITCSLFAHADGAGIQEDPKGKIKMEKMVSEQITLTSTTHKAPVPPSPISTPEFTPATLVHTR